MLSDRELVFILSLLTQQSVTQLAILAIHTITLLLSKLMENGMI